MPPFDEAKLESTLSGISQKLESVLPATQKIAEEALKEAKSAGTVSAETKAKADENLSVLNALNNSVKDITAKLEGQDATLTEIAQKGMGRGQGGAPAQSVGVQFVASDAYKNFAGNGGAGSVSVDVQNAILTAGAGGMAGNDYTGEVVGIARQRILIRDLVGMGATDSKAVFYSKQTLRDNQAGAVAENAAAAESNYIWAEANAPVRNISHIVPYSKNSIDDAPMLQGEIDGEMRYGLALAVDQQILSGDGLGQNLSGLTTEATAYAAPFVVAGETVIDRLRLAFLQLTLADYFADAAILNPLDWAKMEMEKDANKRYILGDPLNQIGKTIWNVPVADTPSMTVNNFLVGELKRAATYHERSGVEILISSEHNDNFAKDMLSMKATERGALAVKRAAAMVTGNFTIV